MISTAFPDLLRRFRYERGLSQRDLGEPINYSRTTILNLEKGSKTPSAALGEKLDDLLQADGMLAAAARAAVARKSMVVAAEPSPRPVELLPPAVLEGIATRRDEDLTFDVLVRHFAAWAGGSSSRREVIRLLGWAASVVAARPLADIVERRDAPHVDAQALDYIEAVLWGLIRQDDALGARATVDTLLAQRNLIRLILPACPEELRPRLLSLYSNHLLQAGWLMYDLADFDSAWHFYEKARRRAHEAEDTELGALVLCTMSHLATWQGQPRVAIDHAVAAQGWASQTQDYRLRAYGADVAARSYAALGRRSESVREIGHAESNLSRVGDTQELLNT